MCRIVEGTLRIWALPRRQCMWVLKKSLLGLALVVGAVCSAFAASVAPLRFDGISNEHQQEYWDYLLRYKLWGTTGVSFGTGCEFGDELGWTGTATGNLSAGARFKLGGPIIVGADVNVNGDDNTFYTGPLRASNFYSGARGSYAGQYCVLNNVDANASNGIAAGMLRQGAESSTGACAFDKVPETKTDLKVPIIDYATAAFSSRRGSVVTQNREGYKIGYIDVPAGEGPFDVYYNQISIEAETRLFVRMPPGGRLTRVFVNSFSLGNHVPVQVIYVGAGSHFDDASQQYTSLTSYKEISNDEYAGNLLFYFAHDFSFGAGDSKPIQGTYICKGTMTIANQALYAGQLIAENLKIGENFRADDFVFVPFDPPIIDFLAAANFPVPEPDDIGTTEMVYLSDGNQSDGAIKLDRTSENDITFKYCFKFEGADDGQASNSSVKAGKADVSWNAHSSDMPLCSADASTHPKVTIKAGDLYPSTPIKVWVYRDGYVENDELFTMHVYDIKGSIFRNNLDYRDVGLFIKDKDAVVGNHAPNATGYTATISENAAVGTQICKDGSSPQICDVQGSDDDGDELFYDIVANNIDNTFAIDHSSGLITLAKKLDYETYDRYPLSVMVSDGNGGSRTVIVTVIVTDVNERPSAQDTSFTIDENSPVNMIVGQIRAKDFETSNSMLRWTIKSGNSDSKLTKPFDITGGFIFVNQYPIDYETKNKYTLGIEVCDDGRTGNGTVDTLCTYVTATINIRNLNEAPIVTHDTCWIKENTTVFLNESGNTKTCKVTGTDPEKGRVTYTLTSDMFKVSNGTITLKSNDKTPDYETTREYPLVVTIADSVGLSSSALALIKVLPVDEKPTAKGCTGTITENPIINAPTGCWIEANDPEDGYEKLTYTITDGDDKNLFTIDGAGNISVNGEVTIDYDTMSPTYYTLKVKVSDTSGNDTTVTAIINVTDINEPPSYTDVACSIKENTEAFVEGANCKIVSEDQEKRELTFKIENGNVMDGSNPIFAINSTTGVITAKKAPDYESFTGTILYISIKDKDENGNFEHTVYAKATITVIDVNEPPTATVKNGTINENSPVGTYVDCGSDDHGNAYYCVKGQDVDANTTLTYTIIDGDPEGAFMVNSVGDILVAKDIIDFETTSEYNLTIRVRDNGKPGELKDTLYVDKSVTITVNNGNERPSVTGFPDQVIDEHTDTATVVGTVTGTDPENGALTYHFNGGNDGQVFAIDSVTGIITVAKDIDFETLMAARADSVFKINVFTKDAEGLRSTETIVTIAIRDINEGADIDDATMTVQENKSVGTTVGTLELFDQDTKVENRQNKYQAIGGDTDLFTIDANTGVIKTNVEFDYEAKTSYSLVVRVYDQDGNADTATVTINIADVKETSNIQVTYAETGSGAWSQTDPDSMLYINENSILLLWTADGKDMCEPQDSCWHENLHEGYNVITLTYTDPAKNKGVTETVVVFVSTRTPEVTVTTSANHDNGASIYTLVETPAEGDTSVYVNKKNNDIVITVKEPIIDETYSDSTCNYETHTFTVNTELEPVTIPSNTYSVMDKIVAAGPVLKQGSDLPPSAEVTYSQYNKDQVKVSYTENVAGVNVTISYVTDKDGNVEKIPVIGANGKIDSIEVITVSYQVNVGGKTVNVSYVADAATGQPLKTTTVNNSASNSGAAANAGNSGSNGGANGSANGGSNSGANAGTNNGSNGGSGSGGNGGSGNANSGTGNAAPVYMYSLTEGEVLYSVTYDFKTKAKGVGETTVQVSYTVDQKGIVTKDKDGNVGYSVSYTYKNDWGNSSTQSVYIVVDLIPPKVKIMSPANDSVLHSNSVNVKWCVDFGDGRGCVEQDSLNVEGLQPGEVNEIVRLYRDKAGNEASDVVYVMAKNTKDVDISVEKPVTSITQEDVDKYYASKEPEKGQTFAISIYNPQTDKEIETQVGGSFKNKDAASEEVYPGLKGHLGPTLGIETKVPVINSVDGLATLDDLVGADGMILLDAVDAVGSKKVSVDEYVENYCLDEFKDNLGSDFSRANIYDTKMKAKIWVYTSLGQFVDYFSFTQDLNDPSYASDAGVLTLYFEMKPDKNGDLHTDNGRLYATGAYVYKTEITMDSRLLCDLPPFDDATNANKRKLRKKVTEDLLKSFGYKRPKSGRK